MFSRIFSMLLALLLPASAQAFTLKDAGQAQIVEVIDGDTVKLSDGREVRMVGTQAPKLPLGRKNFPTWPLATEAKSALEALALNRTVSLRTGGADMDRHGRTLAHLYRNDGVWLQGEMLRQGLARMYTFADNRALSAEMLALEDEARSARRGIWALDWYAIRTPDNIANDVGSFQIVEGRIVGTANVRGQIFLNFGADWKTDFTVAIPKHALRLFESMGQNPLHLKDKTVRVRGWVEKYNGPMIEISHPEALTLLDAKPE